MFNHPIKTLANNRGMSIILMLVIMGVLTSVTAAVIMQNINLTNYAGRLGYPESLQQVRNQVQAVIENDGAWIQTINNNPNLACLKNPPAPATCVPAGAITLFNADGTPLTPQAFTWGGTPCNTFGAAGDTNCIYTYAITWTCLGGPCGPTTFRAGSAVPYAPSIQISATLGVSPNVLPNVGRVNLNSYSVTFTRGHIQDTISNFCSTLTGGAYSQEAKNCMSSFQNPDASGTRLDCWNGGATPYYWFEGFNADGSKRCVADQKLNKYCSPGMAIVRIDSNGDVVCEGY